MIITIIGVGLIGGSLAIALREKGLATTIIGVEANEEHAQKALALQLVDRILPLEEAVKQSELVILATPVDATELLLPFVLNSISHQVVMDVGSIKERVI